MGGTAYPHPPARVGIQVIGGHPRWRYPDQRPPSSGKSQPASSDRPHRLVAGHAETLGTGLDNIPCSVTTTADRRQQLAEQVTARIVGVASEIQEITQSNRELLEHILTDLHDALRLLTEQGKLQAKHDALLEEFRPLLDQFRSPLATSLSRRRRNGARD